MFAHVGSAPRWATKVSVRDRLSRNVETQIVSINFRRPVKVRLPSA